ncbi:MAG: response regulator [Proteobacteria bacterium]|nr:response regulator [Pseudomonadota bacterium]
MASPRILIVDDEIFVRKSLRRALNNYEVVLAADGEEAIAHIEGSEPFDVILCDLMMPVVSGKDVYEYVRENSPGQERRFVFLTGGTVDSQADEFLSSLTNPILEKPFNFAHLRSVVEDAIKPGRKRA